MFLTGKILFANNICNIFSGDDIQMLVEIESQEKVLVKAIFLNFRGEVKVKWEDLINKNKDGKIIYIVEKFEDQQTLIDKHITLQSMVELKKGKYHYDVLLNVPNELPQSVTRKYGSVKYELELGVCNIQGVKPCVRRP